MTYQLTTVVRPNNQTDAAGRIVEFLGMCGGGAAWIGDVAREALHGDNAVMQGVIAHADLMAEFGFVWRENGALMLISKLPADDYDLADDELAQRAITQAQEIERLADEIDSQTVERKAAQIQRRNRAMTKAAWRTEAP